MDLLMEFSNNHMESSSFHSSCTGCYEPCFWHPMNGIIEHASSTSHERVALIVQDAIAAGLQYVTEVSDDWSRVSVQAPDANGRIHSFVCSIPPDWPRARLSAVFLLPPPAVSLQLCASICDANQRLLHAADSFQQFWSDIEELDKHAWVLEPESPNLADIHRRIVVAKHAYLDITINDAAHPRAAPPTLALVGAEATCAPLRQHIRNYRWSSDKSLLDNILLSLSLATLPSPPRAVGLSAVEDEGLVALECGICYAYRMESCIPDQACPNVKCSKA